MCKIAQEDAEIKLCSQEAEQVLLGTILNNADAIDNLGGLLASEFFEPLHGIIYTVMLSLRREGRPITPITLMPALVHEPPVGNLTVLQYLGKLLASAVPAFVAQSYAAIIRDYARRRELVEIGERTIRLAGDTALSPDRAATEISVRLDGIADEGGLSHASAHAIWREIKRRRQEAPGCITGFSTGFPELDKLIDGLRPETMTLIGARPKQGKTALLMSIMQNMLDAGACVAFYSLEMPAQQVISRFIAMKANVDYQLMMRGSCTEEESERIEAAAADVDGWQRQQRLVLDDTSDLTPSALSFRARHAVRKNGVQAVFVDYIQRMKPEQRGSRYEQVTEISMSMAGMRKAIKAPIVAAAQLNRKVVDRSSATFKFIKDKVAEFARPNDGDLRDSGQLEQDGDAVIFLSRPIVALEKLKPEDAEEHFEWEAACLKWRRKAELNVHFNRAGPSGFVDFAFHGPSMRFDEVGGGGRS
jgi:replicative DNA helicase